MKSSVLVYVNDIPLLLPSNSTVLNAVERLGLVVPRFCYHELLEIAGNCRICIVEIEKAPKPIVSCGLPVVNGIRIYTDTPLVRKARESVVEFLLLNHPLDCPICDIGGQCDLQNQAIAYGNNISRYYTLKRSVTDKNLGPLVKTIISRCIHCTRCIRFASIIAGVEDLGTTLRGYNTEVTTYVRKNFNSEVSANIIDLCPVGALTSKVYAFKARPWEIKSKISIDTSDSLGSNTTIESKNSKVFRVLPRVNNKINNEWLSDKARYSYDANSYLRILNPVFNISKGLKFTSQSLYLKKILSGNTFKKLNFLKKNYKFYFLSHYNKSIFENLKSKFLTSKVFNSYMIKHTSLNFYIGRNIDINASTACKINARKLGGDCYTELPFKLCLSFSCFFQSKTTIDMCEKFNSFIFLGVNPRLEATLANLHIRKAIINGNSSGSSFGPALDLTYPTKTKSLLPICNKVKKDHAMLVYGESLSRRYDGSSILHYFKKMYKILPSFIYLPLGSNSTGLSFLGYYSKNELEKVNNKFNLSYFLKAEEFKHYTRNKGEITIYENTTYLSNIQNINLALPLQSDIEKNADFINSSGFLQNTSRILRFGLKPLTYLSDFAKYKTSKLANRNIFSSISSDYLNSYGFFSKKIKVYKYPFKVILSDTTKSDNYLSQSLVLAKVSSSFRKEFFNFL